MDVHFTNKQKIILTYMYIHNITFIQDANNFKIKKCILKRKARGGPYNISQKEILYMYKQVVFQLLAIHVCSASVIN